MQRVVESDKVALLVIDRAAVIQPVCGGSIPVAVNIAVPDINFDQAVGDHQINRGIGHIVGDVSLVGAGKGSEREVKRAVEQCICDHWKLGGEDVSAGQGSDVDGIKGATGGEGRDHGVRDTTDY